VDIRGVEINSAADTLAKHTKTEFKASGSWLQQFSKRHGNAKRSKLDEVEEVRPLGKKLP
jgi:hypothetical protein